MSVLLSLIPGTPSIAGLLHWSYVWTESDDSKLALSHPRVVPVLQYLRARPTPATGGFASCKISIVFYLHLFFCISKRTMLAGRHSRTSLQISKSLERAFRKTMLYPLASARASQQAKVTTSVPLKRFNQARGKRAKTHTYLTRVFTVIT